MLSSLSLPHTNRLIRHSSRMRLRALCDTLRDFCHWAIVLIEISKASYTEKGPKPFTLSLSFSLSLPFSLHCLLSAITYENVLLLTYGSSGWPFPYFPLFSSFVCLPTFSSFSIFPGLILWQSLASLISQPIKAPPPWSLNRYHRGHKHHDVNANLVSPVIMGAYRNSEFCWAECFRSQILTLAISP